MNCKQDNFRLLDRRLQELEPTQGEITPTSRTAISFLQGRDPSVAVVPESRAAAPSRSSLTTTIRMESENIRKPSV